MFDTEEKIFLARSEEFQDFLAADGELKELFRRKRNHRQTDCLTLAAIAGGCRHSAACSDAGGILTPALWSFLWTLENAYTFDPEKITEQDTAIFLYLLNTGDLDLAPEEISSLPERAEAYCREREVDYPEAAALLLRMICSAFRILEVLPESGRESCGEEPDFDLYWLTALGCAAAAESGHPLSMILFSMPLSFCFCCFINHLKKQDRNGLIRRKTDRETVCMIMERIHFLGRQFQNMKSGKI